jgi:hypothetical protein
MLHAQPGSPGSDTSIPQFYQFAALLCHFCAYPSDAYSLFTVGNELTCFAAFSFAALIHLMLYNYSVFHSVHYIMWHVCQLWDSGLPSQSA